MALEQCLKRALAARVKANRNPHNAVRFLEALKILEDATLHSKERDIDTPEVREALDVLDPYCLPNGSLTSSDIA